VDWKEGVDLLFNITAGTTQKHILVAGSGQNVMLQQQHYHVLLTAA